MNDSNQSYSLSEVEFLALGNKKTIKLSDYTGKAILVVNTASECGLTGQYQDLESLYQRYQAHGLVVMGVPCNDFGAQEPGSSSDISSFCEQKYGVSFPMTEKVHAIGEHIHPFYALAKDILGPESVPKWNFHKYLISRKGQLTHFFESQINPMDDQIISALESTLELSR